LVSYSPNGDSALTLQKARHGLRDKRLAQRKVANESNSGMPQRDILPTPLAQVGRRGARRPALAYTIHMDAITGENESEAARAPAPRLSSLVRYSIVGIYST
jgi:hypothetical protein